MEVYVIHEKKPDSTGFFLDLFWLFEWSYIERKIGTWNRDLLEFTIEKLKT